MLGILTLIEHLPDLVGYSIDEFVKKRKERKLETSARKKKIRLRLSEDPKLFIGKTLEELNALGINITQAQLNQRITEAVRNLTDSKRTCTEFKLYEIPKRQLRSEHCEMEERSSFDISFTSATAEIEVIGREIETRSVQSDLERQLNDALKVNTEQKIEIERLQNENKQLRAELENFTPIRSLFGRNKVRGIRNATYPVSSMMNRFILLLLVQGQNGSAIHKFLELLFTEFKECFSAVEEKDVEYKTPSLSHIHDLRKAIGPLCDAQIVEFLENGSKFCLSSDGTRTNRNAQHLIGIGILNENLEFLSLQNKLTDGSTGEELAQEIVSAIPTNIIGKIDSFISDSANVQLKTQRILNSLFNEISGETRQRLNIICYMHTGQ